MVTLSENLKFLLKNLHEQEVLCIQKYQKNANEAKDPVLKDLFNTIKQEEIQHADSIQQILNGTIPTVNCNDTAGKNYTPIPTYTGDFNQDDKNSDEFLCSDTITTEKYVSSAYNFNLYQFGNSDIRRVLNDIETEEQNHAEKLYKYKEVNQMT